MLEEVNRLTWLTENLLTISRADSGHIPLQRTRLRVMDLIQECTSLFDVLVEEKSQNFVIEGETGTEIDADPVVLRQALVNIIDNAVKYAPQGGNITVRIMNCGADVLIDVQDTGPGIPEEDKDRIFDRFYRVDKARWRESGGAGLGLAISKWSVEAHGGSLTLTSQPAQGCNFRITLPKAPHPRPDDWDLAVIGNEASKSSLR